MTETVDLAQLEAYKQSSRPNLEDPHWSSKKLDTAMQRALMPLIEKARNTPADSMMFGPETVNWAAYEKAQSLPEARAIFEEETLSALNRFHNDFALSDTKRLGLVPKNKVHLVYSFMYNMLDPELTHKGEPYGKNHREAIERMFEALDIPPPLTEEEVFKNSRQLIEIAKSGIERAKT